MNIYETPKLLGEYLLFHYGKDAEVMPWSFGPKEALNFAVRSVGELMDRSIVGKKARSLDLGCAVGRSCYELAAVTEDVVGLDYSQNFIDAANVILRDGAMPYSVIEEAGSNVSLIAHRPQREQSERIHFEQGDAMNLRSDLGAFDIVHAANLLCRLSEPKRLLDRLPSLVKSGGQLLLTTPCTWLAEFTPPENWPVGSTFEWLQSELGAHFTLAAQKDMPFLIREHARKFQWSVALGTRWVRR